jgi:LysM repeat protein
MNVKKVFKILILSVAFNIALLSMLIYCLIRDRPPIAYYELKPAEKKEQQIPLASDLSNAQLLHHFKILSKDQLFSKLNDNQMVENGYSQRDLALACLVQDHFFDLSRALSEKIPFEKGRKLSYGKLREKTFAQIVVYPGLTDAQFEKITAFANTEKWPFTSRGLFCNLHHFLLKKENPPQTLIDAFSLTREFLAIEMLFTRSSMAVNKYELIQMLGEGNWEMLSIFTEQQKGRQDLSSARRQNFLLNYIDYGSKTAAYVLLKTDGSFVARKLDNENILKILNLLTEKNPEAEQFALVQLRSPRSDAVWKAAAQKLYDYAGETPPENYEHHAALQRFVKKNSILTLVNPQTPLNPPLIKPKIVNIPTPSISKKPLRSVRYYIVMEGDSLWKISRLYRVDMMEIKKINSLTSDFLKPGTTLKIPIKDGKSTIGVI